MRNWGILEYLARRHTVSLLTFCASDQTVGPQLAAACRDIVYVSPPRRPGWLRAATLVSSMPDLARRLWSPDLDRALAALLERQPFDVIQIEGLEMTPYMPTARRLSQAACLVYDAHNAEYVLQERASATERSRPARWPWAAYSAIQARRLRRFEAAVCQRADAVTCVSSEDAAALRRLVPRLQPDVVANGLNLALYLDYQPEPAASAPQQLVFTGKMDYRPNLDAALWFAAEVMPLVRAAVPNAEFVIVGQQAPPRLRKLHGQFGISVTGRVEDTRPFIGGAAIYVAPLRMGGGTRFKLLEAMALARPVVTTALGAEGFSVQHGREVLIADRPDDFAQSVVSLLQDPARAAALGIAGQEFVRAAYDWRVIGPRLENVYARTMRGITAAAG
jgi:polysaccharide biosynthesis protein PslH